jgi:hypothetical protein
LLRMVLRHNREVTIAVIIYHSHQPWPKHST